MLQSFLKFLELGLYHILNFDGYDHILFVIIVSVPFIFKDWKRLLILISVFTLGHTLSLILGVYDIVNLNVNVTEWLIPIKGRKTQTKTPLFSVWDCFVFWLGSWPGLCQCLWIIGALQRKHHFINFRILHWDWDRTIYHCFVHPYFKFCLSEYFQILK